MEYSGRTTTYAHKHGDAWKESKGAGNDCIQQRTVFDVQWSNCPVEVEDEVKRLWKDCDLRNREVHYWHGDSEDYPIITEYLRSRGVTKCMIVWWW